MECAVCNLRSSEGICVECEKLLCDECGIHCEQCGKIACPDHVHTTSSGRVLCVKCQADRVARRQKRKEELETGAAYDAAQDQEEEEEPIVLAASAREPVAPWKLSLYGAILGAAVMLVLLIFPGLRRFELAAGRYLPTPLVLMIVPAFAVLWAVVSLSREKYAKDRSKAMAGIAVALATVVLGAVAVYTDPARAEELRAAQEQTERENMSPAELEQWRQERLNKYR